MLVKKAAWCSRKNMVFGAREKVQYLHLSLPNCVLDKSFYLPKPQFLPMTNGDRNTYLGGLLQGLNEVKNTV